MKLLIFICFLTHSALSQMMDMNDISILLPVPKQGEENLLLRPTDMTKTGQVLFQADKLFVGFELDPGSFKRTGQTEDFRVIGIRIDHFMRQISINLIWQKPVNGGIYSQASIHTIHTISNLELFLNRLEELNRHYKGYRSLASLPLQVNPTINAQGLTGPYYQSLKKIILEHINPAGRVTFRVFRRSDWATSLAGWNLPIVFSRPTTSQLSVIPEFKAINEPFANWESFLPLNYNQIENRFSSRVLSVGGTRPFETKHFQPLMENASLAKTLSEKELLQMIGRAYMVENPQIIPGLTETECMSCHFAQPVRLVTKSLRPELPFDAFANALIFKSSVFNIQNISPAQNINLTMAFGYAENTAVWNQRVINETADTLQVLYGNLRKQLVSNSVFGRH